MYRTTKVRSRQSTLPQFITNIARVPLMEDPGTRFRYSEATTVVGRLIEIWSGKPLDVFMRERVRGMPRRDRDRRLVAHLEKQGRPRG